ncbi:glycosyltransferase family A protein [Lentimicrobium sp.]
MRQEADISIPENNHASSPLFSVIIPTYNRSHLIKRALNSLVAQTESDWEAIIIDDGSTDDTFSAIFSLLALYPNIYYRKVIHQGEAAARNKGIELCKGEYITFLDSDDEYRPGHLESRKKLFARFPAVNFIHGGVHIIGNPYVPDRFNPAKQIHLRECAIGGTFFIEKKLLLSLYGFNRIELGPDADLYERAKKAGARILKTTLATYIYHRENPDSITNTFNSGGSQKQNTTYKKTC